MNFSHENERPGCSWRCDWIDTRDIVVRGVGSECMCVESAARNQGARLIDGGLNLAEMCLMEMETTLGLGLG